MKGTTLTVKSDDKIITRFFFIRHRALLGFVFQDAATAFLRG